MHRCRHTCAAPWLLSRVGAVDDETRAYFEEFRRELGGVRQELGGVHQDLGDVRQELGGVRETLNRRIDAQAEETRRHFDVTAEALRHQIQTLAEGVVTNAEAIATLRAEIHEDLDARFRVMEAAFVAVRRDIEDLRAGL